MSASHSGHVELDQRDSNVCIRPHYVRQRIAVVGLQEVDVAQDVAHQQFDAVANQYMIVRD